MRHRHRGLSTYGLNGQRQEMSTHAYAPSGRGTIYLTLPASGNLNSHSERPGDLDLWRFDLGSAA